MGITKETHKKFGVFGGKNPVPEKLFSIIRCQIQREVLKVGRVTRRDRLHKTARAEILFSVIHRQIQR